ncbi:MAG TPA: APC family permease [Anaerolineales bacterium]|nr:APC family permease [Anaerolineales bacterium]
MSMHGKTPEDDVTKNDEGFLNLNRVARQTSKRSWRTWLIGHPLPTADAPHQRISKRVGLAVFGADALSSIAYAPQEILVILAAAGTQAFGYAFPISVVITVLLAIVTISYLQTIQAYPGGGGAYTVVKENLGESAALVAGAALLTDYILLAAVTVSSGVAQVVSAFPDLFPYRVWLSIGLLALIAIANLRGVKESGNIFALPTYLFVGMTTLMVAFGFLRYFSGTLGVVIDPPALEILHTEPITLFLLLRAFSNGTTALTGVEVIANGVKSFREPRTRNATVTMVWMSTILGVLFLGIVYLLGVIGAVPSEIETVISQLARTVFVDRGLLYLGTITATTIILILATNTAFAGFPALSAIIAEDGYMPRQLTNRGSRLVFSRGIISLAVVASLLIIAFNASVTALIPLWAVGVFLSFTLSQAGMARHWWNINHKSKEATDKSELPRYERGWRWKLAINGLGSVTTAIVTLIFAITKFLYGAWIIVLLLPIVVVGFYAIHRHYKSLAQDLSLEDHGQPPPSRRHRVIMPVAGIHQGTLEALDYALSLSSDVTVVHISIDPDQTEKLRQKWSWWGKGVRLVVIESPYRTFLEPFLEYVNELLSILQPNERLTILVPQFVPRHWWHNLLHTQTAFWLRFMLLNKRGVVITEVPYQVH